MNDVTEVLRAAEFAAEQHKGHRRKGDAQEPYVNHVIEVARLLAEATGGSDLALIQAGLLHDTIEDTDTTPAELQAVFGENVTALVLEVTDDKSLPKLVRKQRQIEHAPDLTPRAKMLKIADKISNCRSVAVSPPADWSADRKRQYFEWGAAVVQGCRGVNDELERQFDEVYRAGLDSLGDVE